VLPCHVQVRPGLRTHAAQQRASPHRHWQVSRPAAGPSALAVLRLMASSYLVDPCTGNQLAFRFENAIGDRLTVEIRKAHGGIAVSFVNLRTPHPSNR
jgi:hypothetical protein